MPSEKEDRDPSAQDYDWTSSQAVRRVSVGLEVTDFLRGFRLAQLTIWNTIQAGVRAHPEWMPAALEMVDPLMRVYEMGSKVATMAWLEAQRWQVAGDERLMADLLEDLLNGRLPTVLARQQDVYAVVPLSGSGDVAGVAGEINAAVRRLHERGIDVRAGLSVAHATLAEVPLAATLAARARELVGASGVSRVDDMSMLGYLVRLADETTLLMIDPRMREVLQEDLDGRGQFVETLHAYVRANLNAKEAAEELAIHPSTVYYRLERFGERAHCDLRRIDALIEVLLAVHLLQGRAGSSRALPVGVPEG